MPPTNTDVLYAVETNTLEYDGFSIRTVALGRATDLDSVMHAYKATQMDVEPLDRWEPNRMLDPDDCEEGFYELAGRYAAEQDGSLHTFIQGSYSDFAWMVGRFLRGVTETATDSKQAQESSGRTADLGTYSVMFAEGASPVKRLSGRNQTEIMVEAIDYLMEHHDLAEMLEVPWVPDKRKAIINDTTEWSRANTSYKPLSNGLHVDTKVTREGKQRHIGRMTEMCGLNVWFMGDW